MAQASGDYAKYTGDDSEAWVRLQKKAFTAWCNEHLRKREVYISDLATELQDGVKLLHLLELLSGYKVEMGRWVKAPKSRFEKLQNVSWGLKFMTSQGIKIVAIGPEDLVDPKLKLILGLIWLLILKYLVSKGSMGGSAKNDSIAWVRKRTGNDGVKDFSPQAWGDGLLYCGIINSMKPDDRLDPSKLDPNDGLKNVQTAMGIAEAELGVPHILDPEDILAPEELSFITYLSILRDKAADFDSGKAVPVAAGPKEYASVITVEPASLAVGDSGNFKVQLKEAGTGAPVAKGGLPFKAKLTDPSGADVPTEPKDNNNGSFTVPFKPTKAGEYKLAAQVEDRNAGAPFSVVVAAPAADPSKCTLSFAPGDSVPVGTRVTAKLQLADSTGAPLAAVGSTPVRAILASPGAEDALDGKDNGDGSVAFPFTVTKAGDHTVRTFVANKPSATGVVKAAPSTDAGNSSVELSPSQATVGEKVAVKVSIKDAAGKLAAPSSPSDVKATVTAPGGNEEPVELTDNKDGTLSGSFVPTKAGDHTVKASLAGDAIAPATLSVKPSVDASKSTVSTDPASPVAGDKVKATVKLADADGKPLASGGVPVDATLTGPDGKDIPVKVVDNGDGTYSIDLPADKPGDYKLNVKADDKPLAPVDITVKANVDPTKSSVTIKPEAPVAGEKAKALVKVLDTAGNPVAGVSVEGSLVGPDGKETPVECKQCKKDKKNKDKKDKDEKKDKKEKPKQKEGDKDKKEKKEKKDKEDKGAGTYKFKLPVEQPGDYVFNSKADGKALEPAKFNVKSSLDASKSTVSTDPASPVAGDKVKATVKLADADGKPLTSGGAPVDATLTDPEGKDVPVKVVDNGDGTYSIDLPTDKPGDYKLNVKVDGKPLAPTTINVKPNVDASKTETTYTPEKPHQADKITAKLQLKDASGNPITTGGDKVKVNMLAPGATKPEPLQVKDNNDGTYTVEFNGDNVGPHVLEPTVNDASAPASQVEVKPAVDPAQSKAHGPGLRHAVVGRPAEFFVEALNAQGKRVDGVQAAVAIKSDAGALDVKQPSPTGKVPNEGHGHAVVEYTPTHKGQHTVDVTIEGTPVQGSPYSVPVDLPPDAKNTEVTISPEKPVVGDRLTGKVTLKDADGNPITYGGEKVEAELAGPNGEKVPVELKDNNDGTFALSSEPLKNPGEHVLTPKVNGAEAPKKTVNVAPAVDLTKCLAKGDGLKKALVGKKSEFVLLARDQDDKPLAGVPFTVTITGPKGEEIPVTAAPESSADGEISVSYVAPTPGPLTIRAQHAGGDIKGSPFTVIAKKAPAPKSSRSKWTFEVELVDEDGCDMTEGGEDVQVKMFDVKTPETLLPLKFKDVGDGKYRLEFVLPHAGEFEIQVTVGGEHVAGSPFRQVAQS